ncbi:MAG: LapA family protein [Firmicutes bacterium]|nr:LapA family protein [Bacillota bacterium]
MQRYTIGVLLFALLISIFAVQNAGPVRIKLFFWTVPEIPLVLVILGTTLCGLVVGILLARFARKREAPPRASFSKTRERTRDEDVS